MDKLILVIISILFLSFTVSAQTKRLNWIILVDDRICDISDSFIEVEYNDGSKDTINIRFIPGEMIMSESNHQKLTDSGAIEELVLRFKHTKVCQEIFTYFYEIPMKTVWFEQPYFILYVYNFDSKYNRKIYFPLPEKEYNYNISYPGSGSRIIQKRSTKEQKECMDQ